MSKEQCPITNQDCEERMEVDNPECEQCFDEIENMTAEDSIYWARWRQARLDKWKANNY